MALRMCEDCVRDVFADGGAVCRKYATTIRETIQCELQQRNYDPSPCMGARAIGAPLRCSAAHATPPEEVRRVHRSDEQKQVLEGEERGE